MEKIEKVHLAYRPFTALSNLFLFVFLPVALIIYGLSEAGIGTEMMDSTLPFVLIFSVSAFLFFGLIALVFKKKVRVNVEQISTLTINGKTGSEPQIKESHNYLLLKSGDKFEISADSAETILKEKPDHINVLKSKRYHSAFYNNLFQMYTPL